MKNYIAHTNVPVNKNSQGYTFVYMASNIREGVGSKLWQSIIRKTREIDGDLICFTGGGLGDDQSSLVYNLVSVDMADGFISWDISRYDNQVSFFDKFKGYPFIALSWPIPGFPSIIVDSYRGMREVVEHLIKEHSLTKIALVHGPNNTGYLLQRHNAYLDVVKENNIYNENLITPPTGFSAEEGAKSIEILLDERGLIPGKDIEAIVFISDSPALGALKELNSRNIMVPDEITITGCNAVPEALYAAPPMTTITMPFAQQCSTAIDLLLKLLKNENIPMETVIPAKIHLAQSCGCNSKGVKNAAIAIERSGQIKNSQNNTASSNICKDTVTVIPGSIIIEETLADIHEYICNWHIDEPLLADFLKTILSAFFNTIENNKENAFLQHLDEFINTLINDTIEVDFLQDIFTIFQKKIDKNLHKTSACTIAENLFSQARIMITEASSRAKRNKLIPQIKQDEILRDISVKLITNFNINVLMDILVDSLLKLDIPGCYISLYEKTESIAPLSDVPEQSRLIFAYEDGKKREINKEGILYSSKNLLPKGFNTTTKQKIMIVHPLNVNELHMGFIQFKLGPDDGSIYNVLSNLLSSALKGAFLLDETIQNQKKLISTEKMASLGRLTAGIAHEMKTPLAAIEVAMKEMKSLVKEYNDSISQPDVLPEDHQEIAVEMKKCIDLSAKSAEKSISFIRGIKGQTASMTGKIAERFAASDVFVDTFNLLGFKFKRSKCRLVSEIDDSIFLSGNPRALSQIVTNLVNNAIDAADGTEVTITVKFKLLENNHARLTVEDNGPGIPEENLSRIFDPLFTTKPLGESSGLGLGIVKDLVDQFKGTIKVVSSNGITQFTIEIPVADSEMHSKEGDFLG